MIDVIFKNWSDIEEDTRQWAKEIEMTYKPDLIIFIAKSGFLFAKPLADFFCCDMVDIQVSRLSNKRMDILKKLIPAIPNGFLAFYLKYKVSRKNYMDNNTRDVITNPRFDNCDFNKYERIMIVDDSVDTGWSLLKVTNLLDEKGQKSKYKVASYCVLEMALKNVSVDYYRYIDKIVITATSRYSREYQDFVDAYEKWKEYKNSMIQNKNKLQ